MVDMGLKSIFLLAALLAGMLLSAGACQAANEAPPSSPGLTASPPGEIRLGMTNDLAGTGETPFRAITSGIEAYFAMVNSEAGGVCGRKLTLLSEDDQHAPTLALEKTRKLVEQDRVLAMISATGTAAHLGVIDYLNDPNGDGNTDDGIPDLYVSTGFSGWGDVKKWPWTIGYMPNYVTDAKIQARYINENFPDKKVGIIYQNDEFGKDYLNGLREAIAARNLIVSEQPYDGSAGDISAQVSALKDSGAQIVFLAATPGFTAKAIVSARTLEYGPQFFMSYANSHATLASLIGGGTQPEQLQKGFQELDGTISTNYVLSAIQDVDEQALQEHRRIMDTYSTLPLSTLTVYAQSVAELIVETLGRACHNLTRRGLLEAAESIQGFRSSGIEINLGPDDHRAIQALQPVQIQADGTVSKLGGPISIE